MFNKTQGLYFNCILYLTIIKCMTKVQYGHVKKQVTVKNPGARPKNKNPGVRPKNKKPG